MSDRFSIQNTTLAGDKQPVLRITYCLSNQNTVSSSMSVSPIMARKSLRNCFQKNTGPRLPRTRTLGTLQSLFVQSSLLVPPICGPKSKNGDSIFCPPTHPPTTIQASCLHHRYCFVGLKNKNVNSCETDTDRKLMALTSQSP